MDNGRLVSKMLLKNNINFSHKHKSKNRLSDTNSMNILKIWVYVVFIFHINFIFLDVLWEASIVKLWSVYGLTRMRYQKNALLRCMQHEYLNVHHVIPLSIIIKTNKNSYLITVQSDKHSTTKSLALKRLPWKTYFEPFYVLWTLPLCNKRWPANSYIKHTIFIDFNEIKYAVHPIRFLNDLMIGVCIDCKEGFQESSAINEKIQQHNSGLITHWTKSSV